MKKQNLQQKIDALKAGWVRTQADFENYKKRVEQERVSWTSIAKESALLEILPILDNLYFALKHKPEKLRTDSWATGIEHIANQVSVKLTEFNIKRIEPRAGEKFNPQLHEAVAAISQGKSGRIIECVRPGYSIGAKVFRPAQVKTSK